ncbi:MAG: hypothetical protein GEU79_04460 [Acidimicrobiia bacterium]|nr:hypothetical protein [Acidimicrobiia bacterium]
MPAPPRPVSDMVVTSVWLHQGPAPLMVHRLKYRGDPLITGLVVARMAQLLPPTARSLVPIPRVTMRRWRYGVDPAAEIGLALSARTGLPLFKALAAPLWWPHRAGRNRAGNGPPPLRWTRSAPAPVIVDDVVTTGETIKAAAHQLGNAVGAVTVTSSL